MQRSMTKRLQAAPWCSPAILAIKRKLPWPAAPGNRPRHGRKARLRGRTWPWAATRWHSALTSISTAARKTPPADTAWAEVAVVAPIPGGYGHRGGLAASRRDAAGRRGNAARPGRSGAQVPVVPGLAARVRPHPRAVARRSRARADRLALVAGRLARERQRHGRIAALSQRGVRRLADERAAQCGGRDRDALRGPQRVVAGRGLLGRTRLSLAVGFRQLSLVDGRQQPHLEHGPGLHRRRHRLERRPDAARASPDLGADGRRDAGRRPRAIDPCAPTRRDSRGRGLLGSLQAAGHPPRPSKPVHQPAAPEPPRRRPAGHAEGRVAPATRTRSASGRTRPTSPGCSPSAIVSSSRRACGTRRSARPVSTTTPFSTSLGAPFRLRRHARCVGRPAAVGSARPRQALRDGRSLPSSGNWTSATSATNSAAAGARGGNGSPGLAPFSAQWIQLGIARNF